MNYKIIFLIILSIICSCSSKFESEENKSSKSSQASGRINSSESGTKDVFKDLE